MAQQMDAAGKDVLNVLIGAAVDEGGLAGNVAFTLVKHLFSIFFPKPKAATSGCLGAANEAKCVWTEIYNYTKKYVGMEISQSQLDNLLALFEGAHDRLEYAWNLVDTAPNGTVVNVPVASWIKLAELHENMIGNSPQFYEPEVKGKDVHLLVQYADMHIWIMQTLFSSTEEIQGVQYRTSKFLSNFQKQIETYVNGTTAGVAAAKAIRMADLPQKVTFSNPSRECNTQGCCKPRHAYAKDSFSACPWTMDLDIQSCVKQCYTLYDPYGYQCAYNLCRNCNLDGKAEQVLQDHIDAVEDQQKTYYDEMAFSRIAAWRNVSTFMAKMPLKVDVLV